MRAVVSRHFLAITLVPSCSWIRYTLLYFLCCRTSRVSGSRESDRTCSQAWTAGCSNKPSVKISGSVRLGTVLAPNSRQGSNLGLKISPCSPFCGSAKILRQKLWCVGDALKTRDAAHVHNVGLPFTLDNVHAVKVDAERAAATQSNFTHFRRDGRSEERRVGKEWKARWSSYNVKKRTIEHKEEK